MATTVDNPLSTEPSLSMIRLHAMRGGYLFLGVGLALVKGPMRADAHSLPLYDGVVLCVLAASRF